MRPIASFPQQAPHFASSVAAKNTSRGIRGLAQDSIQFSGLTSRAPAQAKGIIFYNDQAREYELSGKVDLTNRTTPFDGDVRVMPHAQVKGTLKAKGNITIERKAVLNDVEIEGKAYVEGQVTGLLKAKGNIEMHSMALMNDVETEGEIYVCGKTTGNILLTGATPRLFVISHDIEGTVEFKEPGGTLIVVRDDIILNADFIKGHQPRIMTTKEFDSSRRE